MIDLSDLLEGSLPKGVTVEVSRNPARQQTVFTLHQGAKVRTFNVTDSLMEHGPEPFRSRLQALLRRHWGAEWPGWYACAWCARGRYLYGRCEACGEHEHRATGQVQGLDREHVAIGARTLAFAHVLRAADLAA
jgi:hypothetical protein